MDKLVAHQKQKPTPIWTLNREVPRALVAVIERLMHKAPEDRYRRVDELIHDLAPLAGSGLTMVPPPVPVDIRTPPPKLRLKPLSSRRSDVETPRSEAGDETHEMPLPPQPRRRGFLGRLFFGE